MTNPSHGPSLAQARDLHSHAHSSHRLGHVQHQHQHQHHHRHQHRHPHDLAPNPRDNDREPATDSDPDDKLLHHRDAIPAVDAIVDIPPPNPTTLVTHVVQSTSLVHIVDSPSDSVESQTHPAPPTTVVVDSTSGETVAVSLPDTATTLPALGSGSSSVALPSLSSSSSDTALTQAPTDLASSSLASVAPSTPLTTPFPTLGDVPHNATDINPSHNGTASPFFAVSKNATFSLTSSLSSSTTLSFTSSTTTKSDSTTRPASVSESVLATFSSDGPIATGGVTNGGAGAGAGDTAGEDTQPTPAASPASDESDLTPQQKQVIVGGVVGSIAGVAFLGLLVMLVLRYKRRRSNGAFLGTIQSGAASRGLPPSGASEGGDGSGSGGAMAERYSPAAITAALAGLTGKGSSTTPNSADGGERGFYRVSGRKLPSVLQVGGDGYSDPRESVMSGVSDYYRGSQAFDPVEGGGTLLALGTPMRPVSGVPIMRSGPARVAITEQNPFADPPSTPPGDDPVPSLASRDSPRGPGSKFQESI